MQSQAEVLLLATLNSKCYSVLEMLLICKCKKVQNLQMIAVVWL